MEATKYCQTTILYPKFRKKEDSLTLMIKSEGFDDDMIFFYLYKNSNQGVQDLLINKLYTTSIKQIEFYIHQLCIMLYERANNNALEKFIYDISYLYPNIALKVFWILHSFIEKKDLKNDKIKQYKITEILQKIESNIVNKPSVLMKSLNFSNIENNWMFLEKILHEDYFQWQLQFTEYIITLASSLKSFHCSNRQSLLTEALVQLNNWLEMFRKKKVENESVYQYFYKGIIWPIVSCQNKMIIGVRPELAVCYKTKTRTPIKIVFEIIDIEDTINWDLSLNSDNNWANYDEFDLSLNNINLEKLQQFPKISSNENDLNKKDINLKIEENTKKLVEFAQKVIKSEAKLNSKKNKNQNSFIVETKLLNNDSSHTKNPRKLKSFSTSCESFENKNNTKERTFETIQLKPIIKESRTVSRLINWEETPNSHFPVGFVQEGIKDPFGEKWNDIIKNIKSISKFGKLKSYELKSIVVKTNDNLKQEQLIMQIFEIIKNIYLKAKIPIFIQTYNIIITSGTSGIIDCINDSISLDSLKKSFLHSDWDLNYFYRRFFKDKFDDTQKNFAESLAGYSILIYLLNIKDRHNGNILIDSLGHIIHIDFGFFLTNSPGSIGFETSPFKLTKEYIDILEGKNSSIFQYFKTLLIKGFYELRKHVKEILLPLQIAQNNSFPCFSGGKWGLIEMESKINQFKTELNSIEIVSNLIDESAENWRTIQYDKFQKITNNINE